MINTAVLLNFSEKHDFLINRKFKKHNLFEFQKNS